MTVLDTTGAPAAPAVPGTDLATGRAVGPAGPDALDRLVSPDGLDALDGRGLRALRAALVDETLRLRRWQRLVRARLDLATDRLSPAEALHDADETPQIPCSSAQGPRVLRPAAGSASAARSPVSGPAPVDLVALVRGQVSSADPADDLRAVVLTHRELRTRALALAGRLTAVDGAIAARDPGPRCCPKT